MYSYYLSVVIFLHNQKLKGNTFLFFAAFVWGISFIAQSKGVESLSPALFNGVRCILGGIVLLPVIFILDHINKGSGQALSWKNKELWIGGVICGIFLCIATTLQSAGMVYTSPGKAGFITALYMVIIPIIGLFTGKRPTLIIGISVIIAVIGLYLMCIDSDLKINKGDILIFICAFVFAGHILSIDHFSPKVDGVKLSCLQFFVCGTINMIMGIFTEEIHITPILNNWASIGYAGIMSSGVAYTFQIVGQKYTDPTSASILMSLESVFATLSTVVLVALGWDLTGGALSLKEILGCILMFTAILLVQMPEKKSVVDTDTKKC